MDHWIVDLSRPTDCSVLALADDDSGGHSSDADGSGARGGTATADGGGVARRGVRHRGGGVRGTRVLRWADRPRRRLPNDEDMERRAEDDHGLLAAALQHQDGVL